MQLVKLQLLPTNGIATTDNVTQAINNSGWNVTSLNNGGSTNGTTSEK